MLQHPNHMGPHDPSGTLEDDARRALEAILANQTLLLGQEARRLAHRADPDSAKQAAAEGMLRKNTHRLACLRCHHEYAQHHGGLTDDEVSQFTGLEVHEARRRCSDLRNLHLIDWVRSADGDRRLTRPSSMGRQSTVSLITPLGVSMIEYVR